MLGSLFSSKKGSGGSPAESPDVPGDQAGTNAAVAKKRWELERGRTRAKVEELTSQLESARKLAVDKNQVAGELVVNGSDVTEAMTEAQHAENNVKILEAALAVAIQKDEAAQRELATAQQAAAIEAEVQVYRRLKEAAAEIDAYLAQGKALFEQRFLPMYFEALEMASDSTCSRSSGFTVG
jgi:predicted ribosome quality control (RQC) complex YloA/Tae2 family protein